MTQHTIDRGLRDPLSLVDLMGYTEHARPNVFALRAAAIQASYLGFSATMGASFMDYVIADPVVLPSDQHACYTEKIVHLPECFLVNDFARAISPQARSREQESLPENALVFCCFNQAHKLLPMTFDVWMRLLMRVEGSVLWLSRLNDHAVANLRNEAQARGVDPARLIFAPRVASQADHLARHSLADLFLDTLPYNAHSTASDALWAGVPLPGCERYAASLHPTGGASRCSIRTASGATSRLLTRLCGRSGEGESPRATLPSPPRAGHLQRHPPAAHQEGALT